MEEPMKPILNVALAITVFATTALAQVPRRPGAEQARLQTFVGTWTVEAEEEGFAYTLRETCEWFTGGFHVVCRSEGTGAASAMRAQAIIGYDTREKTYTRYSHNSLGNGIFMKGSVSGQVWTWTGDISVDGKPMKLRAAVTEVSPTSHTYTVEMSPGGGSTTVIEQGRATKVQ
jgi:hypothetical protein